MHSHTKAFSFIEKHLPIQYVSETQEVLKASKIEVTDFVIRNVKAQKSNNLDVLNALLVVAKNHKKAKDDLAVAAQ